eukprot:GSA25T00008041001.1
MRSHNKEPGEVQLCGILVYGKEELIEPPYPVGSLNAEAIATHGPKQDRNVYDVSQAPLHYFGSEENTEHKLGFMCIKALNDQANGHKWAWWRLEWKGGATRYVGRITIRNRSHQWQYGYNFEMVLDDQEAHGGLSM